MSLRARLLVGMGFVAVVLVVVAFVVPRITRTYLVDQVDAQLEQAVTSGRLYHGGPPGPPDGGPTFLSSLYVGVVDGTGLDTVYTPNVYADDPPVPKVSARHVRAARQDGRPFTVDSTSSSLDYRLIASTDRASGNIVVVGLPLDDVDSAVERLVTVEVVATLAIFLILGLVTWWVMRLGVRPIKQMTRTATAIAGGDLSQRVPEVAEGTEAGELGTALNTMLGRIETAFDERTASEARLRQFVADASHELRTPVTTIRGYAELYRTGGLDDPDELSSAMRRTEQESVRMGALVDDLLQLARLDQGSPLELAPVDMGALATDAVNDARATDPDRPITASVAGAAVVAGDDRRLRQVVGNLVGNALGAHAAGHADRGAGATRRRARGPRGRGPRSGDERRGRRPRVRALLPRRPGAVAPSRRLRPRPRHRRGDGHRAPRHGLARERRGRRHDGAGRAPRERLSRATCRLRARPDPSRCRRR